MSENNRTLKINPDLFKLNSKKKKPKSVKIREKPEVDEENSSKANKIKKELMKKVKDYQKNKEQESIKEEKKNSKLENNNLFEENTFENSDFEREFNKSLNFLQDLAKKNKEKKKNKNYTLKNNVFSPNINLDLPSNLDNKNEFLNSYSNTKTYGCLKNGIIPTYKQLNKTQKNDNNFKKKVTISLENNVYNKESDSKSESQLESKSETELEAKTELEAETELKAESELEAESESHNDLEYKPKIQSESNVVFSEILDKKNYNLKNNESNLESFNSLKEETNKVFEENQKMQLPNKSFINKQPEDNILDNLHMNNDTNITLKNIPKIKRITRKSKYKLGKINGKNKIGILVKNRETQKNIKDEVSILKQKSIQDIKNYLRSKNLIKVGSNAPNDVLKRIYEDAILSGEIKNINDNNMVYNYLNE